MFHQPSEQESQPSAAELLEEIRKHGPVNILVELVEARYRERRSKVFWSIVLAFATLMAGSGGIVYSQIEAREQLEREEREQEAVQQEIEERTEQRKRTATRLQFARTARSFETARIELTVGNNSLPVRLDSGERKQFRISSLDDGSLYRIGYEDVLDPDAGDGSRELREPIPEPIMYLYRSEPDDIVSEPIDSNNIGGLVETFMSFTYKDGGVYHLEVEELIGDPVRFGLTLRMMRGPTAVP